MFPGVMNIHNGKRVNLPRGSKNIKLYVPNNRAQQNINNNCQN